MAVLSLLVSAAARPADHPPKRSADREVLMEIVPQEALFTGSTVSKQSLMEILFTVEPCALSIEGSKTMHRAWRFPGIVGCWYETINGYYVFVSETFVTRSDYPVMALPRGVLHPDGTATITEPEYFPGWQGMQLGRWAQEQVRKNSRREDP